MSGFAYSYFRWLGRPLLRVLRWLPPSLQASNRKIHPEAYASQVGFLFLVAVAAGVAGSLLLAPFVGFQAFLLATLLPVLVLVGMIASPVVAAQTRASSLDTEVPYAAAYVTVMATGGISPLRSFQRLREVKLLPNISEAAAQMDIDVRAFGVAPITAMQNTGKNLPSKQYKDFLMGYASTTLSGGDVTHYLMRGTQTLFEERRAKIGALVERIGVLMEAFITINVLLALGLYSIFVVSKLIPAQLPVFSPFTFFLFAYVLLPGLALLFVYVSDVIQTNFPVSDWRVYKRAALGLPVLIVGMVIWVLPASSFEFERVFAPTFGIIATVRDLTGLPRGFESSLALALTFLLALIPGMIAHHAHSKEGRSVLTGLVDFQRDLVEMRKTGLSPESCIQNLATRRYSGFSKHLRVVANQIGWGLPLARIYDNISRQIRDWLTRINVFLLVDAIDVGGGTPETLETLASFGENVEGLEKQKAMNLRPLMLIPYIGGIILVVSTIILLGFMGNMATVGGLRFSTREFTSLFVPPLVFQALLTGIVAGKVGEERISAGFKHAFILIIVTLIAILVSPQLLASVAIRAP